MSIYGYDPINEAETLLAGLVQVDSALSSTSENPVQNKVITEALSNPNLLDNPWFTVNQRGQSTYNLTENGMTVDRWAASVFSGTMIVGASSNGLTITEASDVGDGGLIERINEPELLGKIVTISIDDGTNIYHATGTIPNVQPVNWTEVCSVTTSGGINAALFISPVDVTVFQLQYVIRVPKDNTAYTIRAVKLELGSVSTLAMDTIPNYTIELAKCRASKVELNDTYANQGDIIQAKAFGELGAKNLLPNHATTQTIYGITWTVNSDGTVTANGTATADSSLAISTITVPKGSYIKTGCPSGGAYDKYVFGGSSGAELGDGLAINLVQDTELSFVCAIANGYTANNLVFKPMIRPASIKDDTYVPYAMTNRELTNKSIIIGPRMSVAVSANKAGWTELNNINNPFTVPTIPGYSFVGAIGIQSSTYRVMNPYIRGDNIYFYSSYDSISNTVSMYPVYVKTV